MEVEDKKGKPQGCYFANSFSKINERFVDVPSSVDGSNSFLLDKESSYRISNSFAMESSEPTWRLGVMPSSVDGSRAFLSDKESNIKTSNTFAMKPSEPTERFRSDFTSVDGSQVLPSKENSKKTSNPFFMKSSEPSLKFAAVPSSEDGSQVYPPVIEKCKRTSNPFAIKPSEPTPSFVNMPTSGKESQMFLPDEKSSKKTSNPLAMALSQSTSPNADSTDKKESKLLLAPPKLQIKSDSSKTLFCQSAVSNQAEKLVKQMDKLYNTGKQGGKENSSDESNVAKISCQSTCENIGKMSEDEQLESCISISSDNAVMSSHSAPSSTTRSTFSIPTKNSDGKPTNVGFIFGQNLHERVLNYKKYTELSSSFSDSPNITFEEAKLKQSLSECAEEFESKQVKRKYEEVAVITGEEEEQNALQINCKLFSFDKASLNWQERGRGLLRLNDKECEGNKDSRLLMRIQGSLRVALNTKVWAGMSVEHSSERAVQFTAYELEGVKVFLVMAEPESVEQLFHALDSRVAKLNGKELISTQHPLNDDEKESAIEVSKNSSVLPDFCIQESSSKFSSEGNDDSDSTFDESDSCSETNLNFGLLDSSGNVICDSAEDKLLE